MVQLPTETWISVFQATDEPKTLLATLRSVNRTWRNITDATPQFWTRLVLETKAHFTDIDYARLYLKNSGDQPLDVFIDLPEQVSYKDVSAGLLALLKQHVSRFRTLFIHVPAHEAVDAFIMSIGHGEPAPLLQELTVTVDDFGNSPERVVDVGSLPDAFIPAPLLVNLYMPANPLPRRTDPHLATLTTLTLDAIPFGYGVWMEEVFLLLESIPHLQHFTFKGSDDYSYYISSNLDFARTISMPNLLSADVSAPGCGLDILRVINAPLLTTVRFDGWRKAHWEGRWESSLTEPISFSLRRVAQRSPNIKRLELHYTELFNPLEDYRWLFTGQGFMNLEVLRLDAVDITDEPLLRSAGSAQSLKRLELRKCRVTGSGLAEFVRGRSDDFELVIDQCPFVTTDEITALSTMIKVVKQ